jgi:hypothetical protein
VPRLTGVAKQVCKNEGVCAVLGGWFVMQEQC